MQEKFVTALVEKLDKKSGKLMAVETMVYVLLAAIAILFIVLAGSFFAAPVIKNFTVPAELSVSTICIVISTLLIVRLKKIKTEDKHRLFKQLVAAIGITGLLFFAYQFFGFKKLNQQMLSGNRNLMVVLIVTHAVHFIVALGFTAYFFVKSFSFKNSADMYIHFLNVKQQVLFKLSLIYWDFLSYIWIALFLGMQIKSMA